MAGTTKGKPIAKSTNASSTKTAEAVAETVVEEQPVAQQAAPPVAPITEEKDESKVVGYKEVTIRATRSFITLPKEVQSETRTRVGAFAEPGARHAYRSLTDEELAEVAIELIGLSANDPKFGVEVDTFYNDFSITIPFDEGRVIKVPINWKGDVVFQREYMRDIMMYRHAMKHPRVANSWAEVQDLDIGFYIAYIEDKAVLKTDKVARKNARKEAGRAYLELTAAGAETRRDWVLEVARRGVKTSVPMDGATGYVPPTLRGVFRVSDLDDDDKELALEEFKEQRPEEFNGVVSDPDLEWKALLESFISHGILRREGNVVMNEREPVGSDDDEALASLKSPSFSQTLTVLKQRLKNARK